MKYSKSSLALFCARECVRQRLRTQEVECLDDHVGCGVGISVDYAVTETALESANEWRPQEVVVDVVDVQVFRRRDHSPRVVVVVVVAVHLLKCPEVIDTLERLRVNIMLNV